MWFLVPRRVRTAQWHCSRFVIKYSRKSRQPFGRGPESIREETELPFLFLLLSPPPPSLSARPSSPFSWRVGGWDVGGQAGRQMWRYSHLILSVGLENSRGSALSREVIASQSLKGLRIGASLTEERLVRLYSLCSDWASSWRLLHIFPNPRDSHARSWGVNLVRDLLRV